MIRSDGEEGRAPMMAETMIEALAACLSADELSFVVRTIRAHEQRATALLSALIGERYTPEEFAERVLELVRRVAAGEDAQA